MVAKIEPIELIQESDREFKIIVSYEWEMPIFELKLEDERSAQIIKMAKALKGRSRRNFLAGLYLGLTMVNADG